MTRKKHEKHSHHTIDVNLIQSTDGMVHNDADGVIIHDVDSPISQGTGGVIGQETRIHHKKKKHA
jgi:hypothetical protein